MRPYAPPQSRLQPWTMRDRKVEATFPVFGVERHALHDPQGEHRKDIYTFICRDWANVVALTDANELVLVFQYRFGTQSITLEVPGGVIDEGESPEEGARRELLEEAGYRGGTFEPLFATHPNPALQGNALHTFIARGVVRISEPKGDGLEDLEVVLVPVEHLGRLLDEGHVTHTLCYAALAAFERAQR